jgi:predicted transcriptional regulator
MVGEKEIIVVDASTGEIYTPQPKKKKRTEAFFMTTLAAAIELAKLDLTRMDLKLLIYLQGNADYDNRISGISQVFIAQELQTTEATISACIKHLEEKGLVRKVKETGVVAFILSERVSTRGKTK